MTISNIASVVVEYLATLQNGTVISTSDVIEQVFGLTYLAGGYYRINDMTFGFSEFLELHKTVHELAKQIGIILDATNSADIPTGLPFHIPFVISKTSNGIAKSDPHFIFQEGGQHTMTWFHLSKVVYSQEYGDPTLPKLADMVSDTPDPYKDIILDYLSEHCIAGCPGIHYDVINPSNVIGCGHLYSDDKYFWTDYFANYVKKYNIPVPLEFRTHILENYKERKLQHTKHRLLKSIRITNNPYLGYRYMICINQNGSVQYSNNLQETGKTIFAIDPKDADYIVHPITESFFCYDEGPNGKPCIDGYHWEIEFYNAKGLTHKAEGWPGEPEWRYKAVRDMIEFIERWTSKDLGLKHMKEY